MTKQNAKSAKKEMDATYRFDISADDAVMKNLRDGDDTAVVSAKNNVEQVRLTFTSAEVGNDMARDSGVLTNQDGGLAVRMQREKGNSDVLAGQISRFDDEGITFKSKGDFAFDVRDLVSGAARGDQFNTVTLGTLGDDAINESQARQSYYVNGGMGNDIITGGRAADFLVGGAGNDTLSGGDGNDSFIGGGGDDTITAGMGDDVAIFNVATDGTDSVDLGTGSDTVNVASATPGQIRLTFTSSEVGNASAMDSDAMANQDGGLAVRLQAEDSLGGLAGTISRFDDEGATFVSTTAGVTFDVRDLVSGTARGDQFGVVKLGTSGNDTLAANAGVSNYINAGMGNDALNGDAAADFLVGGAGDDTINGGIGNDSFIGGAGIDMFIFSAAPGNDTIIDFVSGTDKLDLGTFNIAFANVTSSTIGADTVVGVDTDADAVSDFQITLKNAGAPVESDFVF